MSTLSQRDIEHIFESLRKGLVPERGIEAFAEGIDRQRAEIHRQLDLAAANEGTIKFLRGGYGCGKTFMARLAVVDAQARGFATSFVVVSDNDLRFHRFDDVYRKVMTELGTASCPRGALGDILDRWIGTIEERLIAGGADEDADDFDEQVRTTLEHDLASATGGNAPQDFVRALQTVFDLKQKGEVAEAGALISWLCGSGNVGAASKRLAGVKGDIESRAAMDYLRGVLAIVKAAGYKGLVIVIDEAETILRMRKDSRHKSLNGIRQIADAAGSYHGLLWVFTGTPDFFDSRQGVAGLTALHDRIRFMKQGDRSSARQAQLELVPFSAERLRKVALRLRELYPTRYPDRLLARLSDEFLRRLVADVTAGFKGDVGVVPRQFLRELVNQMDLVDEDPDYEPMKEYGFQPAELSPQEAMAIQGEKFVVEDGEDGLVPAEDVF
ncbi:MAG TPA: BREX system ATP-binding protein BrxD [Nannocystaceae bacterium]|nr:BREX system ATP-binding protein BrxD [Nannocystaceae bacterium]